MPQLNDFGAAGRARNTAEALVVDDQLVLGGVIEDGALTGADDRELAAFMGIEPAYVELGEAAARKFESGKDDVGDLGMHNVLPTTLHGQGHASQKPAGDGNVMRSERPPGVFVGANGAEVQTL